MYSITLGQKSLAALFLISEAVGHGVCGRHLLLCQLILDCRAGLGSWQRESHEPARLSRNTQDTRGAGNLAGGTAHWLQSCCLPRAWIWDVTATYIPGCAAWPSALFILVPRVPGAHVSQQCSSSWGPTVLLHLIIGREVWKESCNYI